MDLPSAWNRTTLTVASGAYAAILLVTVVETPSTARTLVAAVFIFALSGGVTVRLADEHGLRLPAAAFFGTVALLLAAAWWRGDGGVTPSSRCRSTCTGCSSSRRSVRENCS